MNDFRELESIPIEATFSQAGLMAIDSIRLPNDITILLTFLSILTISLLSRYFGPKPFNIEESTETFKISRSNLPIETTYSIFNLSTITRSLVLI